MAQPLKETFLGLQGQMLEKLRANRKVLRHAPTQGAAAEVNWVDWLKEYLPKRYEVDSAFVLDSQGNWSDQIDLVIYDHQYTPFVLNQDGVKIVPAESVYAVFEVKPEISKANLEYAGSKIASVRTLHRTSAQIIQADGRSFPPKPPFRILGGFLSLENSWADLRGEPFQTCISNLDVQHQIDIGCCLAVASFNVDYSTTPVLVEWSSQETALVYWFLSLIERLQALGTVPAIEISAYKSSLS